MIFDFLLEGFTGAGADRHHIAETVRGDAGGPKGQYGAVRWA